MTRCVTKTTLIIFIDGNKLKSCRMGLTNHTWPISRHWLLMADTQSHTHTYQCTNKNNFKKPGACSLRWHTSDLTTKKSSRIDPLTGRLSNKVLYNRVTAMVLSWTIFKPSIFFPCLPPAIRIIPKYISNMYLIIDICNTKTSHNYLQQSYYSKSFATTMDPAVKKHFKEFDISIILAKEPLPFLQSTN